MVKLNECQEIILNGSSYAVCTLVYKGINVPVIMDLPIYKIIKKFDKSWHINDKGFVVTMHKSYDNQEICMQEICMHDIIMKIIKKHQDYPLLHINKLGIDNRTANLMYDTKDKDVNKNIRKKKRIVDLPDDSGIDADDLPSFVWYLKENGSHGDRFVVEISDYVWKSTSSKKVSLRYKLEETKKYLRHFKQNNASLFDDHAMNGDLNKYGNDLLNSFYDIAFKAGFTYLTKINKECQTDSYLEQNLDGLSNVEKQLLSMYDPATGNRFNFR